MEAAAAEKAAKEKAEADRKSKLNSEFKSELNAETASKSESNSQLNSESNPQKLYEVLNKAWELSQWRKGHRFVSKGVEEAFKENYFALC